MAILSCSKVPLDVPSARMLPVQSPPKKQLSEVYQDVPSILDEALVALGTLVLEFELGNSRSAASVSLFFNSGLSLGERRTTHGRVCAGACEQLRWLSKCSFPAPSRVRTAMSGAWRSWAKSHGNCSRQTMTHHTFYACLLNVYSMFSQFTSIQSQRPKYGRSLVKLCRGLYLRQMVKWNGVVEMEPVGECHDSLWSPPLLA